jgi:catechol 2,3-dioxygenase-like lactoylglutathione lyase family enzyme
MERITMIESISAVTLATHNMPRAVRFYRVLGFEIVHGDDNAAFTSFRVGASYLNLTVQPAERHWSWWGRVIFYNSDVDALYRRVIAAGYRPDTAPRDAEWGERFFLQTFEEVGLLPGLFLDTCLRRAHAMGDVHRRADFVGGRR